jgi:hypothetical protein
MVVVRDHCSSPAMHQRTLTVPLLSNRSTELSGEADSAAQPGIAETTDDLDVAPGRDEQQRHRGESQTAAWPRDCGSRCTSKRVPAGPGARSPRRSRSGGWTPSTACSGPRPRPAASGRLRMASAADQRGATVSGRRAARLDSPCTTDIPILGAAAPLAEGQSSETRNGRGA